MYFILRWGLIECFEPQKRAITVVVLIAKNLLFTTKKITYTEEIHKIWFAIHSMFVAQYISDPY